MIITDDQLETLRNLEKFSGKFLQIKLKEGGSLIPFKFKKAQKFLDRKLEEQRIATSGVIRAIICKGRQLGCSTYVQGRFFRRVITKEGMKAYILTHRRDATDNIFSITNTFYENLPPGLAPKADTNNSKKLYFSTLKSGYAVGTAASKTVGRSETIQLFHGSEVALWENAEEIAEGIMQTIPEKSGTEIILESTAQGMGNYFHNMWRKSVLGENSFIPIFLPWYWDEDYISNSEGFVLTDEEKELLNLYEKDGLTIENMAWRRKKINNMPNSDRDEATYSFQQEYPMNAEEAFKKPVKNSFILGKYVQKARNQDLERTGSLIIGVDIAISEKDRTAIIRRRGRSSYNLERLINHNTMEIVGRVRRIITEESPDKVYIDCIGIGAGVVDRLQEMGYHCVEGVNVGRSADEKEKFKNLRAQLWSYMKDWFCGEMPVQIPDEDALHSELCCLSSKETSQGQLQIESKDDLRARGMPSPDGADALSLTFYGGFYGVKPQMMEQPKLYPHERGMFR